MTLIKSLLLGSSATLIAVASAQAADLPTKKGAPAAEYVKVCKIGGIAGFILPGSDTCLKISGAVLAQAAGGSLSGQTVITGTGTQAVRTFNGTDVRDGYGESARADLQFEAVSNTANGPLISVADVHFDQGYGSNVAGPNWAYINEAYIQWAGITAGIKPSFYDYLGGGEAWFNFLSPEHTGTGIPLFAYTATFGGGFSATISLEQPGAAANSGFAPFNFGQNNFFTGVGTGSLNSELGARVPDIVGSLDLAQAWGGAHLAGVAHQAQLVSNFGNNDTKWGYGFLGGITFNLPSLGAGDDVKFQGAYSHAAIAYSGFTTADWGGGDNGLNINGNGQIYDFADGVDNGSNVWSTPTTWEAAAELELHLTPQFEIAPEISYAQIQWSNRGSFVALEGNAQSWLGGAVLTWTPVTNLSFGLDLIYQASHYDAYSGTFVQPTNGPLASGNADGFNGRFRIERDF